jgi:hypothetical protein
MPLYRFQIEVPLPRQRVMERIRSLMRERPSVGQWFCERWKPRDGTLPPFIGSADENSFRIHRDIRYRNSFLPLIRGYVFPTPTGTQINVTMSMYPASAVFMILWLGITGSVALKVALTNFPMGDSIWVAMSLFFVAFICGAFFWEAFKAKRILADAFSDPGNTPQTTGLRAS